MATDTLIGTKFGDLTVIERVAHHKVNTKYYCRCVCGVVKEFFLSNLRKGKSSSCGCTRSSKVSAKLKSHGKEPARLYGIWTNMKTRCTNSNSPSYEYYGAKGISVCDEWFSTYEIFRDWALANGYGEHLTIDRIDNSRGYCPDNCRWANNFTQARNRGVSWYITINGVTKHAKEWCQENAINYKTAHGRKSRGWEDADAVTLPTGTSYSSAERLAESMASREAKE